MKYLMLLNNAASEWEEWQKLSAEQARKSRENEVPRWNALFAWAGEQGIELNGVELEDPAQARVVRVRDGDAVVTDGPFAETKEAVGGFDILECDSLEEAVEIAAGHPVAQIGTIEVRPLRGS